MCSTAIIKQLYIFKYSLLNGDKLETKKPTIDDLSLGNCPHCQKEVLEKGKFYGCSGYQEEGCTLPKEFLGKKITPAQIRKILKNGKTDVIKGFVGKKGNFDTALGYDKESKRLSFVK
jgi:DNA topoisomerase-3